MVSEAPSASVPAASMVTADRSGMAPPPVTRKVPAAIWVAPP